MALVKQERPPHPNTPTPIAHLCIAHMQRGGNIRTPRKHTPTPITHVSCSEEDVQERHEELASYGFECDCAKCRAELSSAE